MSPRGIPAFAGPHAGAAIYEKEIPHATPNARETRVRLRLDHLRGLSGPQSAALLPGQRSTNRAKRIGGHSTRHPKVTFAYDLHV